MAYTPGTGQYAQGDRSIREDLGDQVKDIDVIETRVSSSSATVTVSNQIHSWVEDPIEVVSSQVGAAEFADTTFVASNPTSPLNVVQTIEYGVAVSGQSKRSDHVWEDELAREKFKKMKTWKNQLEFSAVVGTAATATGTAAKKMNGIVRYATTSTGHSSVSLTSDILNFFMKAGYDLGAKFDNCLVGSTLKQRISSFTSPNQRNIEASSATVVYRVDVYDSDFGRLEIHPHQYINSGTSQTQYGLCLYQSDVVRIGVMDEVHYEDRARMGYYEAGSVVGMYTAEVGNGKGVAYVYGLL